MDGLLEVNEMQSLSRSHSRVSVGYLGRPDAVHGGTNELQGSGPCLSGAYRRVVVRKRPSTIALRMLVAELERKPPAFGFQIES